VYEHAHARVRTHQRIVAHDAPQKRRTVRRRLAIDNREPLVHHGRGHQGRIRTEPRRLGLGLERQHVRDACGAKRLELGRVFARIHGARVRRC
jgi:hypothetical protein